MNNIFKPLLICICCALICCGYQQTDFLETDETYPSDSIAPPKESPVFGLKDFYRASPALDSIVQQIYDSLTVKQRAAQLIMEATTEAGSDPSFARARKLIADSIIGGLLFLKGKKSVFEAQIKKLDSIAAGHQAGQLIYSCDCEPTLYHKKFIGANPVKASSKLKDSSEVKEAATKIASAIRAMGIQINFAPVADIALNRKAINNRSFGNNPAEIIQKSAVFVEHTQMQQIAACVKHFPGHGAVEGDTHKGQVVIDGELREFKTFQSVISRSDPVMVMIGHMTVKNNALYGTGGLPCSVSSVIITKLLKTELGYKGIVVTDAMQMNALDAVPEADWKALLAGADLVLMPRNARLLNSTIIKGFSGSTELRSQLEASVKKMLRLKVCTGRIR